MSNDAPLSTLVPVLTTAVLPLIAFVSLSIFLATHPRSPTRKLVRRRIALPVHRDEGLDGEVDEDDVLEEKDPFEIDDPVVRSEGIPVNPERFWSTTWKRKAMLLAWMILPFGCNIAIIIVTALSSHPTVDEKTHALATPCFVAAAHLPTLFMMYLYLSHDNTKSNWQTTIHLSTNLFAQFLVIALLALLPSTPPPRRHAEVAFNTVAMVSRWDVIKLPPMTPLRILQSILPILQFIALVMVVHIRRGPPMHMPLDAIYPAKIVEAIPPSHESMDPNHRNVSEEVEANILEWMFFSYATPVVKKGSVATSMDVWDVPVLPPSLRAMNNFLSIRRTYTLPRSARWEGYNLLWMLAKINAGLLTAMISIAAVTAVLYYLPHYILQLFIVYLENDPSRSDPAWGWLLAFSLFVANASVFIITGIDWSITTTYLQGRIQVQLNSMLFAKTLRKKDVASGGAEKKDQSEKKDGDKQDMSKKKGEEGEDEDEDVTSKSQIMNLFTVDADRVNEFVLHAYSLVDSPIEIVVATMFLINLLGPSALWGLLTSLLCMPLTHLASKVVVRTQENLMKARDKRTGLMNEILSGIRMLKFMAWERSFQKRVNDIRTDELHWQATNYKIEVAFNALWEITPILVTVVAFLHYTLVAGKTLTPSVAFTSIAVFDELRFALGALPETFLQALQGLVSCRRIERYLHQEEVTSDIQSDGEGDIVLANATFTWPRVADSPTTGIGGSISLASSVAPTPKALFTLADMTVRFPHGKLSLICGRLGSGKSLLLAGLLGEADLLAGHVECPRSVPNAMQPLSILAHNAPVIKDEDWIVSSMVAYVPQQAWLQNASIKDNVVFSSPFSESRYQAVLEACSLLSDLEILEDGDETEIGEKGLNLSGGQKARVSLARAVYSRAATLLLDDVLSAVDAHTAHAIMENCLNGPINAGRTILLVSHHTALVSPSAAYIVALENGDLKFKGTREEFVAGGLMAELDEPEKGRGPEDSPIEEKTHADSMKPKLANKSLIELQEGEADDGLISSETSSIAPDDEATLSSSTPDLKNKPPRKLIEDERRATGRISSDVWKTYITALGGPFWWACFIFAIMLSMAVSPLQKGWLRYWTSSDPNDPKTHSPLFYVVGYSLITLSGVWMDGIQYAVMYWGSLKASKKLQASMLQRVLFAPLRFHDTTSRGRLLNRFSKDIEGLDSEMADHFVRSISYGASVLVTFVSIAYVGGLPFVGALAVVLVLYYKAGSIYGQTSRDMRRLNSVTRSPLYSLFGETVSGVSVIRAFGASTISLRKMLTLADTNLVAYAWTWTVNRWLSARFNILSSIIVGVTALICLLAPGVNASTAGFALAFANSIQHDLLFVVRRFVQLEQSMVALERIKEYTELPQEAAEFVEPRPPASWPHEGAVSVEKLVVRYAPDLPNVLHGISFSVKPKEKIGIVGATGCGKSTLALSFFRFVEAHSGKIVIDGIDISKIGLTDLRGRVTIIPQDPTILSGTLRSTLDVFDEYDDADIYAALKRVHLLKEDDDLGPSHSGQANEGEEEERNENVFKDLSNPVSEGGDNFSTGEKQLICMARAILRRNKLLLMDEATASIDYETDALISKTIREEFSGSTILTIAHRIHTIIDFDKVLVMDKGAIAEFASPAELLRNHKSKFYALCKATGRAEFKTLREMAFEAEKSRA